MESMFPQTITISLKDLETDQTLLVLAYAKSIIRALQDFTLSAPRGSVLSIEFRVNQNTDS